MNDCEIIQKLYILIRFMGGVPYIIVESRYKLSQAWYAVFVAFQIGLTFQKYEPIYDEVIAPKKTVMNKLAAFRLIYSHFVFAAIRWSFLITARKSIRILNYIFDRNIPDNRTNHKMTISLSLLGIGCIIIQIVHITLTWDKTNPDLMEYISGFLEVYFALSAFISLKLIMETLAADLKETIDLALNFQLQHSINDSPYIANGIQKYVNRPKIQTPAEKINFELKKARANLHKIITIQKQIFNVFQWPVFFTLAFGQVILVEFTSVLLLEEINLQYIFNLMAICFVLIFLFFIMNSQTTFVVTVSGFMVPKNLHFFSTAVIKANISL